MVKDTARTGSSDKPGKGSVIVGDEWAFSQYSDQEEMIRRISAIYVRTKSGNDERIRRILAHAANIGGSGVYVTASADLSQARNTADDSLMTLGLIIGVIALIVGGMSIANTMIVTVMERRDEIGLRRALGATQRIDDGACRIRASSCSEYCDIAQRIPVKYVEYFVSRT